MHDDYVDRTTNGSCSITPLFFLSAGMSCRQGLVCEKTLDEIKSFDAGSWFGEAYSGERVPMLSEVNSTLPADEDSQSRLFAFDQQPSLNL